MYTSDHYASLDVRCVETFQNLFLKKTMQFFEHLSIILACKNKKLRYGHFDPMAVCSIVGASNNPHKPMSESHPRSSFFRENRLLHRWFESTRSRKWTDAPSSYFYAKLKTSSLLLYSSFRRIGWASMEYQGREDQGLSQGNCLGIWRCGMLRSILWR